MNAVKLSEERDRSADAGVDLGETRLWLHAGLGGEERAALAAACTDVRAVPAKRPG